MSCIKKLIALLLVLSSSLNAPYSDDHSVADAGVAAVANANFTAAKQLTGRH